MWLFFCAGVAEFGRCSPPNGCGGSGATHSWELHGTGVGEPGNWTSASSGELRNIGP